MRELAEWYDSLEREPAHPFRVYPRNRSQKEHVMTDHESDPNKPGTHSQPPHKTKAQEDRDPTTKEPKDGDNIVQNSTKEQREREERDRQAANRSKAQAGNPRDAQAGQPVDYVSRDEHEKLRQRVRALESKAGMP